MLFNFQNFIEELRQNEEKKEMVEKYIKYFGPINGDIKDQKWYVEYISKFKPLDYDVPAEIKADFDRALLMQFVAGSFSSDGLIDPVDDKDAPEFVISVQSGDQVVVKKVSELRGFQIVKLFEIYIEEQMNLLILVAEDDATKEKEEEKKEKMAILSQREARTHRRGIVLDNLDKEVLKKAHESEKTGKLDDLMGQL